MCIYDIWLISSYNEECFRQKLQQTIETHFMYSNFSSVLKFVPFIRQCKKYGTTRQATDINIIWRLRIACWITKATQVHSEYVTLIAFPLQQWLHERASLLRYTYVACLAEC